jgi:hypothetical protein
MTEFYRSILPLAAAAGLADCGAVAAPVRVTDVVGTSLDVTADIID